MLLAKKVVGKLSARPKISVCMATYQGERYITHQLQSILEQLSSNDEVIIVDDCSTDATCTVIKALQDVRIVLIRNASNQGVLRTFETALSRCSGEIVFLSDQDDLWRPNKVRTVLNAFNHDPKLMLVASDAILIDESGNKIADSFYAQRGKFRSGIWSNLLIGKFHGCTMAFRRDLLRRVLPFPPGTRAHHDTWIGCVNALIDGKTQFIAEPLVAYRRHGTNVTGRMKNSTYTRLRIRLPIVVGLILFWIRNWSYRMIDG
jgi:glycosyltransferase involved in cell wall biosynthesis